jgi:hypothetical protein
MWYENPLYAHHEKHTVLTRAVGLLTRLPHADACLRRRRQAVWACVRELIAAGVTILLTAQYLEEADALADNIVLIDTVARWLLGRRRS